MKESLSTGDSSVGDGVSKIIKETAADLDTPLDMISSDSKTAKKAAVEAEQKEDAESNAESDAAAEALKEAEEAKELEIAAKAAKNKLVRKKVAE